VTTGYRAEASVSRQDDGSSRGTGGVVAVDPGEICGGLAGAAAGPAGGTARSAIRIRAICWLKNLRW
jgi:hypothetical protein